jgi:hypothetical protein
VSPQHKKGRAVNIALRKESGSLGAQCAPRYPSPASRPGFPAQLDEFTTKCRKNRLGYHMEFLGTQFVRLFCDAAEDDSPVYTADYFHDAKGTYRTWSSLMTDQEIIEGCQQVAISCVNVGVRHQHHRA